MMTLKISNITSKQNFCRDQKY